jgi:ABC-type branched-subunit amino acid transport system substrate-binding protein
LISALVACGGRRDAGPTLHGFPQPGESRAGAGASEPSVGDEPVIEPVPAWLAAHVAEPKVEREPVVAALVLPLSGPHARLGAEIRAAVDVARADAGFARVAVFDTRGTEAGAAAAVGAALEAGANVILGPVGQRESRAAARRAVAAGVPIALLSPDEHGAAPGAGVYRLWPSAEHEAALAASIAVELGYESLAVLAPRDEHGAAAEAAFTEAARRAGAEVVTSGGYDPTATELEPDLKDFLDLDPATNARLRAHLRRRGRKSGWKSFSPDVSFELLYIPDRHDRAALVASYLPYYNVELRAGGIVDTVGLRRKHGGRLPSVVQLLGSSGWHHPSLVARGGAAVDGALVVALCVGGPNEDYLGDRSAQIAARLRRAAGRSPSPLASQAYDAARLFFDRLIERGRADLGALAGARLAAGACGPAVVDGSGQLRREPILLRVDAGELVPHEW